MFVRASGWDGQCEKEIAAWQVAVAQSTVVAVGSRRVTPGGGSRHAENDQAAHEPDDSEAPPLPCLPPEIDPDSNCDEVRGHAIPQSGGVIGEKEPNDHDDHDDECAHQRISARVKGRLALKLRAASPPAQEKWTTVPCPPGHNHSDSFKGDRPASFKRMLGRIPAALSGASFSLATSL